MRVLGLMTSHDAVAMAVLETDGRTIEAFGPAGVVDDLAAVEGFLAANGPLDLIGLRGEGDAESLARRLGVPVAHDFGEGPLAAVYYRARVRASGLARPVAVADGADVILIAENGLLSAGDTELLRRAKSVVIRGEAGWWGDFVEAEAVAYIAARCWNGFPISFPGTTGAPYPMTGGRIVRPQ